jgi:hypothetical protein
MASIYTSLSGIAVVAAVALALLFKLQNTSQPEELLYKRIEIPLRDADAPVQHLAKVLTFKTVGSAEAPNHVTDEEPFKHLHRYLQNTYPLVYEKLKQETVGGTAASPPAPGLAVGARRLRVP